MRIIFLIFLLNFINIVEAKEEKRIIFHDPEGDDYGPGTYVYPAGTGFEKGSYDLKEVLIKIDENSNILVDVTLSSPPYLFKNFYITKDERKDIFLQVIDIYIDVDKEMDSGFTHLLPGRQAKIANSQGWEKVLIITSIKNQMRQLLKKINPEMKKKTCFPLTANVYGKTISAIFSKKCTGEISKENGFLITISSITFTPSIKRWIENETAKKNLYLRGVTKKRGNCPSFIEDFSGYPCTFGGCTLCINHPQIIDAIIGEGESQEKILSNYNEKEYSKLPIIQLAGIKQKLKSKEEKLWTIIDKKGKIFTLKAPLDIEKKELFLGKIGFLKKRDGKIIAKLVITGSAGEFVVTESVEEIETLPEDVEVIF